jgi:N-acetylglucosaminyldiphosphoundecaprenol N-acetyl-beta-D-mannosaminyltransferase
LVASRDEESFSYNSSFRRGRFKSVGPVEFVCSTPLNAPDLLIDLALERRGRHVHFANAYTISLADKIVGYRDVLAAPALNFVDGKPIEWFSRLRRDSPTLTQVRGPRLFLDVIDRGRLRGVKHFLLGSTPLVLKILKENLQTAFPGASIVGAESPPFRALTNEELSLQDQTIQASGAHIVWVGLGTPKQDVEARRLAQALPVVAIGIGAAFDFAAGTTKTAPRWMQSIGMEWAFRLLSEPRRLWRRYFFGNIRFMKAALLSPNSAE